MNRFDFFSAAFPLIGLLGTTALGAVVTSQRRDRLGLSFSFLCALLSLWNLYFFLLYVLPCDGRTLAVLNLLRVAPILLPVAVLYLAVLSGGSRGRAPYWALEICALLGVALVVGNAFGQAVSGLRAFPFGCYSVSGPLYDLYTAEVLICFGTTLAILFHDLRQAENPQQRTVAKFWFLGAAVGLPLGATNLLPAYGIPMYPLGNLGSAVWAATVAYAILQHRLLDIDAILSRGITLVLSGLAVLVPAAVLVLLLQYGSFGQVHADFTAAMLLVFLFAAGGIHWVHARALKAAERRAAEQRIQQRVSLDALIRLALQHQSRDRLFEAAADAVQLVFAPPTVVIGYRPNRKERIALSLKRGMRPVDAFIPADSPLVKWLDQCEASLLPGELLDRKDDSAEQAAKIMQRNRWAVCVPFKTGKSVLGLLAVGLKNGIDVYSANELESLERVGAELTLALDNFHMRDEVGIAQDAVFRSERLSSLGTMVAAVVHEVRNPLVSLSTFVQLVEDRVGDRKFFQSAMPVVKAELDRVGKMLETLLSYTHVNKPVFGPVYFDVIFERVRLLLEPHAKRFAVKLEVDHRIDGPVVRGDEDRLMQVVFNLVMNAIEASPPGGVVRVEWDRVFRQGEYFGVVRVADQGPGIPASDREHIFLPFFTTKANGSGLGLSVSLQIIGQHHGFLEVSDGPGGGAVFTMAVPVYLEVRKNLLYSDPLSEPGVIGGTNPSGDGMAVKEDPGAEKVAAVLSNTALPPEVRELQRTHEEP